MKTIFSLIFACSSYETQFTSFVKEIKYTAPYECHILLDVDRGIWKPHYNCPLSKEEARSRFVKVTNCDLHHHQAISGYLIKTPDGLELEE